MNAKKSNPGADHNGDDTTALIHLLQYVRADVAKASPPAGIAIDLAVALLKEKVRAPVPG